MFSNASGFSIQGGTFNSCIDINQTNRTPKGIDLLLEWVATGAFHNSDELYDAPKCHPHTRVAVLDDIMRWVGESGSSRDDFMLWLFGPAGAGKSAIGKKIAEIAAEKGLLIATFFFARTSPTRSTKACLVATLAYQLALSIPDTRPHIEHAIERDPVIFNKNLQTQIDTLLIKPFQSASLTQIFPSQKLIIIDGLDECNDSPAQVAILDAISCSFTQHNLPIIFLVLSRPEAALVTAFNCSGPLKSIHRRLALDDTYRPDQDIRLFFLDKFEHIRLTHFLRSTIPISWPTQQMLETLVKKSSGQFIYAATVVRFVESIYHRPSARLNMVLGISRYGSMKPFAELDALYNRILFSVDDIRLTLRVLGLYAMAPRFALRLHHFVSMSIELFLSLEQGDIDLALINLSSIVFYDESSGEVKVLHASLVDFLSDKHRSTIFYIDMASTCTDFVRRILHYVKGPDGIRAGDLGLFHGLIELGPWLNGQLLGDILNFDLDAFIAAVIRYHYKELIFSHPLYRSPVIQTFRIWMHTLGAESLEDRDKKEALDRCIKSFESRVQIYQSNWRLKLLLTLAVANIMDHPYRQMEWTYGVPGCRCADILLEMHDHDLHLADQDALDLRHGYLKAYYIPELTDIMSLYVDGDRYASAALHCMCFLSNPPKYFESNDSPEIGLTYAEWKSTCAMALNMLCRLLTVANTSPALVQFMSNHDIDLAVQKDFSVICVWHILGFLSRAGVCVNWRIVSAIRQALFATDQTPSTFKGNDVGPHSQEDWEMTQRLMGQRLDQCCSNVHPYPYYK